LLGWCTELHIPMDRKLWLLGLPIDVWYRAVQEGSLLEARKSEHQAGDSSKVRGSSRVGLSLAATLLPRGNWRELQCRYWPISS
ncbi:hypothetical protein T08_7765, partial [Trichinella sp. T8]